MGNKVLVAKRSPVSDDGRGLKPTNGKTKALRARGSPVSDDGRGLKRAELAQVFAQLKFARQ